MARWYRRPCRAYRLPLRPPERGGNERDLLAHKRDLAHAPHGRCGCFTGTAAGSSVSLPSTSLPSGVDQQHARHRSPSQPRQIHTRSNTDRHTNTEHEAKTDTSTVDLISVSPAEMARHLVAKRLALSPHGEGRAGQAGWPVFVFHGNGNRAETREACQPATATTTKSATPFFAPFLPLSPPSYQPTRHQHRHCVDRTAARCVHTNGLHLAPACSPPLGQRQMRPGKGPTGATQPNGWMDGRTRLPSTAPWYVSIHPTDKSIMPPTADQLCVRVGLHCDCTYGAQRPSCVPGSIQTATGHRTAPPPGLVPLTLYSH